MPKNRFKRHKVDAETRFILDWNYFTHPLPGLSDSLAHSLLCPPAVDKTCLMVGSYGPKPEPQEFVSALRDAPRGMLSYGQYVVKSRFMDDDRVVHLEWEWNMAIKKDWD